jgi:hypothetical protein
MVQHEKDVECFGE